MKPPDRWFAEATALELGLQLELRAVKEALEGLPRIPDGAFLSINCSHRTAASAELAERLDGMKKRIVLEITEHEAIDDYGALAEALEPLRRAGSGSPSTTSAPGMRACDTRSSSLPTW